MPVHLRGPALTVAACSSGVRVFTQTKGGDVREGCNNTTDGQITQARHENNTCVLDHGDGWFPGDLRFSCSPDSALCAVAWAGCSLSVFYQTSDGCIRERRHLNAWEQTAFVQPNCMMGTDISVVYSSGADYMCLCFQDDEGYLCYRCAERSNWGPTVRLQKAVQCTGIGATAWHDCKEIRVYFHDEGNVLREYRGGRNYSNWLPGDMLQYSVTMGGICAISWLASGRLELRVYFQTEDCYIVEWCYTWPSPAKWMLGSFRRAALPNSNVVACMRNFGSNFQIHVLWAGHWQNEVHPTVHSPLTSGTILNDAQVLWQTVHAGGWLKETPIAFLQPTGRFRGSWGGILFTDNSSSADAKVIRQLHIRYGDWIDGLALDFTDGTSTSWHGGQGGKYSTYTLQNGEDFIHIRVAANETYILGLQFITSKGRESPWYGSKSGTLSTWELDGRALAGFMGSTTQYMYGLMPFWSERYSPVTLNNLQSCIAEGENIRKEIALAATRCAMLRQQTEGLQHDVEVGLRVQVDHALTSVGALCETAESLCEATQKADILQNNEIKQLVTLCKSQAALVAQHFGNLSAVSTMVTQRGDELDVELTARTSESEERLKRLHHLQSVADGLRK